MHVSPPLQAFPQAPQFAVSVCRSLQPAGLWQQVCPGTHAAPLLHEQTWFAPTFLQASPAAHSVPVQLQRPLPLQVAVPAPPSLH